MINGDDSTLLPANPLLDDAEQDRDWLLDDARLDLRLLDDESSWAMRNDLALAGHRFDPAIPTLMVLADGHRGARARARHARLGGGPRGRRQRAPRQPGRPPGRGAPHLHRRALTTWWPRSGGSSPRRSEPTATVPHA